MVRNSQHVHLFCQALQGPDRVSALGVRECHFESLVLLSASHVAIRP